jgi:hypothetical protein
MEAGFEVIAEAKEANELIRQVRAHPEEGELAGAPSARQRLRQQPYDPLQETWAAVFSARSR